MLIQNFQLQTWPDILWRECPKAFRLLEFFPTVCKFRFVSRPNLSSFLIRFFSLCKSSQSAMSKRAAADDKQKRIKLYFLFKNESNFIFYSSFRQIQKTGLFNISDRHFLMFETVSQMTVLCIESTI